ncbi:MAG: putative dual-specificity RNA methyltransferase RlmN [Lentisphaerae bacterium ADurb.BinA184]|nr:MAG: putative dual-specificity RNA methyltransferase RlmN [Lentisphaerae bacterium ADurb.BinA184]
MKILFKNHTADELHGRLAGLGASLRVARQFQAAVLRRDAMPAALSNVSDRLGARIREAADVPHLRRLEKAVSPQDGFAKYLFLGDGPDPFEAVRIPLMHRPGDRKYVVCVSSQVGCALGCRFCTTGRMGYRRDLATWEIVDQVVKIQADSPHPVRGVVFMGMGEPLLNYDAVMRAARILSEPCGLAIAAKAITIATAGIVPGIRRLTAERLPYRLMVSLTAAEPARRRELMPVEDAYPTADLMGALREYHAVTGRRVILAWTLIAGFNTRDADARALADLTRGLPVKIDLVDVNDPSGQFLPPAPAELDAFRDALRARLGMPVARRYSGGRDIAAACGMLAGRYCGTCAPLEDAVHG